MTTLNYTFVTTICCFIIGCNADNDSKETYPITTEDAVVAYVTPNINITFKFSADSNLTNFDFEFDFLRRVIQIVHADAARYLASPDNLPVSQLYVEFNTTCPGDLDLVKGENLIKSSIDNAGSGWIWVSDCYSTPDHRGIGQLLINLITSVIHIIQNYPIQQDRFLFYGIAEYVLQEEIFQNFDMAISSVDSSIKWRSENITHANYASFLYYLKNADLQMEKLEEDYGMDLIQNLNKQARQGIYNEAEFWPSRFHKSLDSMWQLFAGDFDLFLAMKRIKPLK